MGRYFLIDLIFDNWSRDQAIYRKQ